MVVFPDVTVISVVPGFMRGGGINLRGKVLPVIDLRLRMGKNSLAEESEELVNLLELREQDHTNWLIELEASVKEKRAFKLATNPHQCPLIVRTVGVKDKDVFVFDRFVLSRNRFCNGACRSCKKQKQYDD